MDVTTSFNPSEGPGEAPTKADEPTLADSAQKANGAGMTLEEAQEILGEMYSPYGDWDAMEVELVEMEDQDPSLETQERLAEALAYVWRKDHGDPGFMQPGGILRNLVEAIIGEPIWEPVTR